MVFINDGVFFSSNVILSIKVALICNNNLNSIINFSYPTTSLFNKSASSRCVNEFSVRSYLVIESQC